jgi:hypothetical protein
MVMATVEKEKIMKHPIFIQSELLNDVTILEIEASCTPAELRKLLLDLVPESDRPNVHVYVEDDDEEDALNKLNGVPEGLRVQLHRLKSIDVTVHYAGHKVTRTFRPSATVGRVKKWATHELGITPSDAAEMALQISGTDNRPDSDVHIGALVHAPTKTLSFDLVPSPRVNG